MTKRKKLPRELGAELRRRKAFNAGVLTGEQKLIVRLEKLKSQMTADHYRQVTEALQAYTRNSCRLSPGLWMRLRKIAAKYDVSQGSFDHGYK